MIDTKIEISFLAKMAMAKVTAIFNKPKAKEEVEGVWEEVFSYKFNSVLLNLEEDDRVTKIMQADPVLNKACVWAVSLANMHKQVFEMLTKLEPIIKAEFETHIEKNAEDSMPDAANLMADLKSGKTLNIKQHSLSYDSDMELLVGTNPYGCDYYAGHLDIASVSKWRNSMQKGRVLGDSPFDDFNEEVSYEQFKKNHSNFRQINDLYESIDQTFMKLLGREGVTFSEDLDDVTITLI